MARHLDLLPSHCTHSVLGACTQILLAKKIRVHETAEEETTLSLPSDDQGAGNYANIIGPGETLNTDNGLTVAQSQLGIGTQGSARITDTQVPNDLGAGSIVQLRRLSNYDASIC